MKRPFAPLGCAVMAHVKPKNRRTWDTHAEMGFNIGTAMEHHQYFHVYIVKTRATRVSDRVFFKHQYITNPQITPETLVIKAVVELTNVLKGTVSRDSKTAEALQKVSSLFTILQRQKQQQRGHETKRTPRHTDPYHFQGWATDHPHRKISFHGCRLVPQRLIVA